MSTRTTLSLFGLLLAHDVSRQTQHVESANQVDINNKLELIERMNAGLAQNTTRIAHASCCFEVKEMSRHA